MSFSTMLVSIGAKRSKRLSIAVVPSCFSYRHILPIETGFGSMKKHKQKHGNLAFHHKPELVLDVALAMCVKGKRKETTPRQLDESLWAQSKPTLESEKKIISFFSWAWKETLKSLSFSVMNIIMIWWLQLWRFAKSPDNSDTDEGTINMGR